jgi:hypothetical protein
VTYVSDEEIADRAISLMVEDRAEPDPAGWVDEDQVEPAEPLFVDIAAILAKGIPPPPAPVLLRRTDGHALFYAAKVNVLFGDPECGKTWIALAAIVEALNAARRAAFIDLDHNGAGEVVSRLLLLGATPEQLGDPERFRFAEPGDGDELIQVVAALRAWRAAVAVMDSLGELLPLLGLSSNSPDDYTQAHRRALTPLSRAGAVVIAIDHLPKSDDAREHGQTGTMAKRRAVNGVTLRVTVSEPFAPGRGGAASMTIGKDRPGGVRAHCPAATKNQPAGRFVMTARDDGSVHWKVTEPHIERSSERVPDEDLAELDSLVPGPRSKRDVQDRLGWGSDRSQKALSKWRDLRKSED